MTNLPIMLFAAGFGTRMGALTADRPKPMVNVAGRPLVDHALDLAQATAPPRIVANLHYKPRILADHLAPKGVIVSHEYPDILDTGGGLRAALPLLGQDPVMTLNTDAIWRGPNPLQLLQQTWDPSRMDALLICVAPENALGHKGNGDFTLDPKGRVTRGHGLVFGGAQIIKTNSLSDFPDLAFSLNLVWDRMIANNRVYAVPYPGRWCDVGHPEGIALAEGLIASHV